MTKLKVLEAIEAHPSKHVFEEFSILDLLRLTEKDADDLEDLASQLTDEVKGSVDSEITFLADWLLQHKMIDI